MTADRILSTHVGSLPRPDGLGALLLAKGRDEHVDEAAFEAEVASAVKNCVRRQVEIGLDLVSDGEMSKISYATYVAERLSGFGGDSPRRAPADLEEFPGFLARQARTGGTPSYRRPQCIGPIAVENEAPMMRDLANLHAAIGEAAPIGAFLNAASPGVVALFQPNAFYPSDEAYLEALAAAMASEYRAILAAGFDLQIDSPDLGLGRHTMFKGLDEAAYVRACGRHVEALNAALAGLPKERIRLHVCWGNYEGPHHCDAPLSTVLPLALAAHAGTILFEAANPRHAHEWTWFETNRLPEDVRIAPGVIDSTTNFIEHPELIAQRIETFARLVGPDRVIASTDCGFATFAGFGAVDPDIAWAKLAALAQGAEIASRRVFGAS